DLAFSYRDYRGEVAQLVAWFKTITRIDAPTSVLELACGPGRYLHEFARGGVHSAGIDISESMCSYASALAADLPMDVYQADITGFELGKQFDLILLMLNSVSHILDEGSLSNHFSSVADHLAATGIYVVEASRVGSDGGEGESSWQQSGPAGSVSVTWRSEAGREIGRINGSVYGETVDIHGEFPMRQWRTQELTKAARQAGLKLAAYYGDFSLDRVEELRQCRELNGSCGLHPCFVFTKDSAG
ncbi:MAG: class I SAM-dependent methyltransferase, partial [Xanthomonadales bacterium]|nr:class I SAM-dependent methyltransferase [Xanthomonadales bacterium]